MTTVLVTGGTGALGKELVPRLVAAGLDVRVLSRKEHPGVPTGVRTVRGDLDTGEGLDGATSGVDVIAHLASGTDGFAPTYRKSKRVDVEGTRRLIASATASTTGSGSPHIVYISIVGIDKVPLGYYRAKLETEKLIESSGFPYTILRTTQWHTLAEEVCRRLSAMPATVVPKGFRVQLLDASEVAERMRALVQAAPAQHVADMGGPEALELVDVLRRYVKAKGKRRVIGSVRLPGKLLRALREGHNLTPSHTDGRITWDDYLARTI